MLLVKNLQTPVALFIFRRPDTTAKVFTAIREAKPRRLLVIADAPRPERKGELECCMATRAIVERIDWPCEVSLNYAEENLGCRLRLSSGLDWVFQEVEEAIILEDDCLPHPDFFNFCEVLLDRYRGDTRIGQICGGNFQFNWQRTPEHSYYFSRYCHVWGWASWRRAWHDYDVHMSLWPQLRDAGWLGDMLGREKRINRYWAKVFDRVYRGEQDTWDYQLTFTNWVHNRLCILPNVNLVTNIGDGIDATHTVSGSNIINLPTRPMKFPLVHPPYMIRDGKSDTRFDATYLPPPWLVRRIKSLYRSISRRIPG